MYYTKINQGGTNKLIQLYIDCFVYLKSTFSAVVLSGILRQVKICKIKFYAQKSKSQISTSLLIKCNMNNFFSSRSGYNFLYTGPILRRENQQLHTRYCRERWD